MWIFSKFRKLVRVRKDQIRYHLTLQRLFYIVFTEMIFLIFIFLVLKTKWNYIHRTGIAMLLYLKKKFFIRTQMLAKSVSYISIFTQYVDRNFISLCYITKVHSEFFHCTHFHHYIINRWSISYTCNKRLWHDKLICLAMMWLDHILRNMPLGWFLGILVG